MRLPYDHDHDDLLNPKMIYEMRNHTFVLRQFSVISIVVCPAISSLS
jgi:hypothetical protein